MRFYQILLAEAANYDQLLSQFNDKLKLRFGQDNSIDNNTEPMEFIIWADKNINPTSKHEVLQWIIKTYVDGGIRLSEDLSRTKVALAMYFKYKNAMPMSLNGIKKLNELESMVEKYGKQSKKSAASSDTRGYAKETTEVIYNGPEGKILWPRTKGASCVYGAGTKWCISATKSKNYFNDYSFTHNKHFLFILPAADGTKWALVYDQKTGNISEAFNENDDGIEPEAVFRKYPWVKKLLDKSKIFHIERDTTATDISKMKPQDLVAAIINKLLTIKDIKNIDLSKYQQLALVEYDARYLRYIKNPPLEVQLAAVNQIAYTIKYIKKPSEQVQLAAVNQIAYTIKYIKHPQHEVQLAAVNQDGLAIEYINQPSEQIQLAAVNQDGYAIQYIKHQSVAVQLAAVNRIGHAIKYIKYNAPEQVLMAAVNQFGHAIKHIKNPSLEVQLAAVKRDGLAIEYINNPSEEVQLAAVNQNGYAIQYIKDQSAAVQLAAVNRYGLAIEYINRPSEQVQLAAIAQAGYAIQHIKNPSEEVQLAAVKLDGHAIQHIKNPSDAVQLAAVNQVSNPAEVTYIGR